MAARASRCGYRPGSPPGEGGSRVAALGLCLILGGCGVTFPMASLVPEEPQATAGVAAPRPTNLISGEFGTEDWRRAKNAMALALDPQGSGAGVAWENPDTAMRGEFTPVGQPFVKDDDICRAFLATVVGQATTQSLQGTACRPSGGDWTVKDVRPFRKLA